MKIKILNLYSGIGGNRKLWPNDEIEVTAVEIDPQIANIYHDFFPQDKVIIGDAHQYLLNHYQEYDFIWSSPPCPTHSRMVISNQNTGKMNYPDMKLYEEIILLKHFFHGKWCVENVISYYDPLIQPYESESHYYWSNFHIPYKKRATRNIQASLGRECGNIYEAIEDMENKFGIYLADKNMPLHFKFKILKNCVQPKIGLMIFNMAFKEKQATLK